MKRTSVKLLILACVAATAILFQCDNSSAADRSQKGRASVQLVVRNLAPGQEISEHEWGIVKVEVGVEARRAVQIAKKARSKRTSLRVKVDDKEAACSIMDSSMGYEGKKAYAYRTLGIRLGPKPGPKTIAILYAGFVKRIPVDYEPSGQIEFMGLYGDEAVFGKAPESLRWLGCYLVKESVKTTINGEPVASNATAPADMEEILEGSIPAAEKLKPGSNTVRIEAVDIRGAIWAKEIILHYYPDNRVPAGDAFAVNLGVEETKSGPFYDAVVEGRSLVKTHEFSMPPKPERIGGQTVVPRGKQFSRGSKRSLRARASLPPGKNSTLPMRRTTWPKPASPSTPRPPVPRSWRLQGIAWSLTWPKTSSPVHSPRNG